MSPFRGSAPITDEWRHFDVHREGGVATITLNRPDRLNALTFQTYADLRDLLAEVPHRDDTRVVVLRGEGPYAHAARCYLESPPQAMDTSPPRGSPGSVTSSPC
jgi:1,4-dihydroxy-2-naphthoyl-CoA synthase